MDKIFHCEPMSAMCQPVATGITYQIVEKMEILHNLSTYVFNKKKKNEIVYFENLTLIIYSIYSG